MNAVNPEALVNDLGGNWYGGYGVAPCPVCQPERRKDQNALTINAEADHLLLHCKKLGCDFRDILTAAGVAPGTFKVDQMAVGNARRERAEKTERTLAYARSVWRNCKPITGTKGEAYLRARGITCDLPVTLRWLPDTYHTKSRRYVSAMVGDVSTGAVHRTYFTKQGMRLDKATGTRDHKMMLGSCSGGGVRLSEGAGPLVVCEGLETGLSLLSGLLSRPASVWACLSASGIAGVTLPSGPTKLIVATDGDDAGRIAGVKLAIRATALGWQVSMLPAPNGRDWSDVLQGGVAA
jgi:hypothetical protein